MPDHRKDNFFMGIAFEASKAGTCLRRRYGAIVVRDGRIVAVGHNGAPDGVVSCLDTGICDRDILKEKDGEAYQVCRGIHSEWRAFIQAGAERIANATLYIAGIDTKKEQLVGSDPCPICWNLIKQYKVARVVCHSEEGLNCLIERKHPNDR